MHLFQPLLLQMMMMLPQRLIQQKKQKQRCQEESHSSKIPQQHLDYHLMLAGMLDNLIRDPTELGHSAFFYPDKNPFAATIAPYGVALQVLPLYVLTDNVFLTNNVYVLLTYPLTAWAGSMK